MSWLVTAFKFVWGLIFNKPSQEAVQATKAATAQTQLDIEVKTDAKIQTAAAAIVSVDKSISTDDGLRKYEQTDPNNRDNQ